MQRVLKEVILLIGAYTIVVILTWALIIMNMWGVVSQYEKDHNKIRLYSYLTTLLILGSLIIGVASAVVQHVMDSQAILQDEDVSTYRPRRIID